MMAIFFLILLPPHNHLHSAIKHLLFIIIIYIIFLLYILFFLYYQI